MSQEQSAPHGSPRALLVRPPFSPELVGGLPRALRDVGAALEARGWQVDARSWAAAGPGEAALATAWQSDLATLKQSVLERSPRLRAVWMSAALLAIRRGVRATFKTRAYFEHLSDALRYAEKQLGDSQAYDVVLLYLDGAPPGFRALATDRHRRAVTITLFDLESELRSSWWPWERWVAGRHLRGGLHPYLFRRVMPARVRLAIFASAGWEKAAIQAGLPPANGRSIYFGIPLPKPLPRHAPPQHRILWVGRLTREKGLHWLLRALPLIRHRLSDVTLTVIAGQGPAGYRQWVMRTIKERQLEAVVTVLPPVERADLQTAYATHDVLFFHSVFAEPVALVLMEAFAAGLPVVAAKNAYGGALLQDNVTCLCYRPGRLDSLADAVVILLTDAGLRQRLADTAQNLVLQKFSLDKMGQRYDETLREFISTPV